MKQLITTLLLACAAITANAQYENTKIKAGMAAPELALKDTAGKDVKLSSLTKNKIVLLDFWASWCHPCRLANPRLVDLYKRYSDKKFKGAKKGFTVVSVSLDQDKARWIDAITKDGLLWPYHISDLGGWRSKAASEYGVEFIPQAMLVGPDGKIVATYTSAEQAEADLQKMLK